MNAGLDCLERALFILEQGQIDLDLIITHTLPLSDVKHAFEMFETQKDSTLKMIIDRFS